ncbi:ATP-grasp domain-containing protein [Rossellomorea sp. NRS-1567]|uniref:ATP-grasp domain-containing protein n=1 Tax=Rossellomorea sp. NRS-1567 TaxID=3233901 RepID=UPI003D2B813E
MIIGLIAGSSGDALTDQLQKSGFEVALVAGKQNEPGYEHANHTLVEDMSNKEEIERFFSNKNVRSIVIGTGHKKVIELAEYLESKGFVTSINPERSQFAKDKIDFKENLIKSGFTTPNFYVIEEKAELKEVLGNLTLPCVVKSAIDLIQPRKANDTIELEDAVGNVLATGSKVLIEEFVSGTDYTVPVKNDGNKVEALEALNYNKANEYKLIGFEKRSNPKMDRNTEEKLKDIAVEIVKKFNFTGLVRVDCIVENGEVLVLELNSVIVTGYKSTLMPFYKEAGIDIAKEMIDVSLKILRGKEELL